MARADKHMRFRDKKLLEFQIIFRDQFAYDLLILRRDIEDPDLTFHAAHILYDLIGLCLPQREIILIRIKRLDHVHKRVDRKRIMLTGYRKTRTLLLYI